MNQTSRLREAKPITGIILLQCSESELIRDMKPSRETHSGKRVSALNSHSDFLDLGRMTSPNYRVRRATLDDIGQLATLWHSMKLPAEDLGRRITEFQVAEG